MFDDCDGNMDINTAGDKGAAGDGGGATIQLISMCVSCYWGSRTMIAIRWLEVVAGNLPFIFKLLMVLDFEFIFSCVYFFLMSMLALDVMLLCKYYLLTLIHSLY
jgi:hypothetical protein